MKLKRDEDEFSSAAQNDGKVEPVPPFVEVFFSINVDLGCAFRGVNAEEERVEDLEREAILQIEAPPRLRHQHHGVQQNDDVDKCGVEPSLKNEMHRFPEVVCFLSKLDLVDYLVFPLN